MSARAASRRSWLATAPPTVGVEIAARRVTAVALGRAPEGRIVAAHAIEPLPVGAVVPTLTAANLVNRDAVVEAVKRALGKLGERVRRVALVVPDSVAKVSLVRFERVPTRADELDQLVRWQVRKTAPFRIEDAQIAYAPGIVPPEGGREFIVALTRRDVVEEYENACAAAGVHTGVVDLASFNLVNAVLAGRQASPGEAADWLLVHVTPEYSSLAIVRGGDLIFFRNRTAEGDGSLADMVHQTAMYYEDRLGGGGFGRVYLAGAAVSAPGSTQGDELRRGIEERLAARVELLDPRAAAGLRDRITASPELLDALAPAIGLVLREAA